MGEQLIIDAFNNTPTESMWKEIYEEEQIQNEKKIGEN